MRKLTTLLLSIALVVCLAFGLVGCGRKDSGKDPVFTFPEDGAAVNGPKPKDFTATRADSRAEAYTLYDENGTAKGNYKNLANAANDAVELGVGSYVTRVGDSTKMFYNPGPYDDESVDCYWFYENGVSLDTFDCWNKDETLKYLKNSEITSIHTTTKLDKDHPENNVTKATQLYNGYTLFDKAGGTDIDMTPQIYEIPSALDSVIATFPQRKSGMTKLTYEIDLRDVKITPAYTDGEESSQVFAFMGFYLWADYYVVHTGIACDTKTGNWYPYTGTSRNNSAGDTVYSTDNCVMTSTWNEKGGYFVPDAKSATMCIETKMFKDEDDDTYQVDDFSVKTDTGAGYSRRFTDETINQYFSGQYLKPENSYIFIAGLDIINDVVDSENVKNADYSNGAKFENLTITNAKAHMPTEEEMTDEQYGELIENRGQDMEMMFSKGGSDTIQYGFLSNNVCSDYKFADGKDVYSFGYDLYDRFNPLKSNKFGSTSKPKQDKIDALGDITEANAMDRAEEIFDIDDWYANGVRKDSTLAEGIFNALDFAPYLTAKETLKKAAVLNDAGQKVVEAFNALPQLHSYVMKSWEGTGDGYLYTDILAMKALMDERAALDEKIQQAILFHIDRMNYLAWEKLTKEILAIQEHEKFNDAGVVGYNPKGVEVPITPDVALKQIIYWAIGDDGIKTVNNNKINFDTETVYQKAEFIYHCAEYLKGLGIQLPEFYTETLNAMGYEIFASDYKAIEATIKIGTLWAKEAADNLLIVTNAITPDQATLLTQYWSSSWTYQDAGLDWNMSGAVDNWTYSRLSNAMKYYTVKGSPCTVYYDCLQQIHKVLEAHGYKPDAAKYYRMADAKIEAKEAKMREMSPEATTFMEAWKKIGPFTSYKMKGWAPEGWTEGNETDVEGNLYVDMFKVKGLSDDYAALSDADKKVLALVFGDHIEADFAEWAEFKTELAALQAEEKFNSETVILDNSAAYPNPNPKDPATQVVKETAVDAFKHIIYRALEIRAGSLGEGTTPTYIMEANNQWYPSIYIVNCVQAFEAQGLTLPKAVKHLLETVEYDAFFEAYNAIYQTVSIAQHIHDYKSEGGTTDEELLANEILASLSTDQIAMLNKYWNGSATVSSLYSWNFYHHFRFNRDLISTRVARVIKLAGGTLTEVNAEKETVDSKFGVYLDIVWNLLQDNGYDTKKAMFGHTDAEKVEMNDWGVENAEITNNPLPKPPVTE